MKYSKNIILFLLICVLADYSYAQTQNTSISIRVVNQLDEAISDAEITLFKSKNTKKRTKTDKQGLTRFSDVSAGEYQIIVIAQGFKDYKSESIATKVGDNVFITVILEIAPVESKVEVSSDEADSENFGTNIVLEEEAIDKLPNNPADFERVLRQIAGQSVTGEDLPVRVDGFENSKVPPKEMIRQIRISQNVFSAQFEGQNGESIEIFTKSDVENFSGSIDFNFADSRFNAANPFINQRLPSQTRGYSFSLFGPLIRKRASFSLFGTHLESDSSTAINAFILNSGLHPTAFREFFANPSYSDEIQLRIKADLTKKHQISFGYAVNSQRNKGQGVGNFALPSRAYNFSRYSHDLQFSDTWLINENVVNQTRFQILYSQDKNFGGTNEAAVDVLDAFSSGGSQIDNVGKDFRFELLNDTAWQIGKYGLGFGWKLRGRQINQISRSNFGGTHIFSGRLAPILGADNNPVFDAGGNIITEQINSLESYRRTLLFRQLGYSNQRIRELGGGASQFSIASGNPEISADQFDVGLYLQNSYKVRKEVVLSFGLRYENQTNIKSNLNFSPRFGIIWSPKADKEKSAFFALPKVSAGFGAFYSRFSIDNTLWLKQASDEGRSQYFVTDADVLDFYPNIPTIDLLEQSAAAEIRRVFASEINTPLLKLFNVNVSKKLPSDFSVSFSYSRTASSRLSVTRNINAPIAGTYDPLNLQSALYPISNQGNFIYQTSSNGVSETDWFNIRLGIPTTKHLQTYFNYNFGKVKNDLVSGSGSPFDPYDFSREFGKGIKDGQHTVSLTLLSNLPFGFSVLNMFRAYSGTRFNVITGRDTNGDGFFTERPAFASDLTKPDLVDTEYGILDPNPSPNDPIIPRNLGSGPAIFNLDTLVRRNFKIGINKNNPNRGRYGISVGIFIRNILNVNNKGNPIGNMSSPFFLKQIGFNSDNSTVFASSAGVFSGFEGRTLNFNLRFGF